MEEKKKSNNKIKAAIVAIAAILVTTAMVSINQQPEEIEQIAEVSDVKISAATGSSAKGWIFTDKEGTSNDIVGDVNNDGIVSNMDYELASIYRRTSDELYNFDLSKAKSIDGNSSTFSQNDWVILSTLYSNTVYATTSISTFSSGRYIGNFKPVIKYSNRNETYNVKFKVDNNEITTWSETNNLTKYIKNEGTYTLTTYADDNSVEETYTIIIDNNAPILKGLKVNNTDINIDGKIYVKNNSITLSTYGEGDQYDNRTNDSGLDYISYTIYANYSGSYTSGDEIKSGTIKLGAEETVSLPADNDYRITYKEYDKAGNYNFWGRVYVTLDSTNPTPGEIVLNGITKPSGGTYYLNENSITLSSIGEADSGSGIEKITYDVNKSDDKNDTTFDQITTIYNTTNLNESANLNLNDGLYNITLRTYDNAKNSSMSSIILYVDTLPPDVDLEMTPGNESETGKAYCTVTYSDDYTGIAEGSASYSYTGKSGGGGGVFDSGINFRQTGSYAITVKDRANNTSTLNFSLDADAPTIDNITTTATTNSITINATVEDDYLNTKTFKLRKQGTTNWTTNSTGTFTGLEDNTTYEMQIEAVDNSGNTTTSSTFTKKTDDLTVSLSMTDSSTNNTYTADTWTKGNVNLLATTNEGASAEICVNGSRYIETHQSTYTLSDDGTYDVWANATDGTNNVTTRQKKIKIDKTGPTVTAPVATSVSTNSITVGSTVTDTLSGVASVQYAIKKSTDSSWGSWQSSGTFNSLLENTTYQVKAYATDNVGNTTESSVSSIVTNQNTFTVTYKYDKNGNGIYETYTTRSVTKGSSVDLTNVTPTVTGSELTGWSETQNGTVLTSLTMPESDLTLYAVFEKIEYTLTLIEGTGIESVSESGLGTYEYGETITVRAIMNDGYEWGGWTSSSSSVANSTNNPYTFTMPAGNITLTANSTARTTTRYKVEHYKQNLDGTYNSTPDETEILTGTTDSPITPEVKTYNGFTSPSVQEEIIAGDESTEVQYYYTRNSYTLTTTQGNGISNITKTVATNGTSGTKIKYGAKVTLSAQAKSGYEWSSSYGAKWESSNISLLQDSTAQTRTFNMPAGDITLTAKIPTPISYSIAYDLAGGSLNGINPTSYTVESESFTLINPTRTGYVFLGWREQSSTAKSTSVTINKGTTGNKSYTAVWGDSNGTEGTPITYTITYNLNGGTETTTNPTTYNVETETFTLSNPTKTGYNFSGWTGSNGTTPSKTVTINKGSIGNLSYVANWTTTGTETDYTVYHYKQNISGGNNYTLAETENKKAETNASVTPAIKAYTGFNSPTVQTVTVAADGSTVVRYYYTRQQYALTIVKGKGIESIVAQSTYADNSNQQNTYTENYYYEQNVNLKATAAEKYTWNQWTGSDTTYSNGNNEISFTMPAKALTLTASATINKYKVEYYNETEKVGESSHTCDVAKNLTTKAALGIEKTGYEFKGWATEYGSSTVAYGDGQSVTNLTTVNNGVVKLYAVWKDETGPTINSVIVSPILPLWTNGSVMVKITATDDGSGISGYSFNNGSTWDGTYTNTYSAVTTIPANTIQVKDIAGNITKYNSQIEINNIDKTAPTVTTTTVSKDETHNCVMLHVEAADNAASGEAASGVKLIKLLDGDYNVLQTVEGASGDIDLTAIGLKANTTYYIEAIDNAENSSGFDSLGNIKPNIKTISVNTTTLDVTAPTLTVNAESSRTGIALSIDVREDISGIQTVKLYQSDVLVSTLRDYSDTNNIYLTYNGTYTLDQAGTIKVIAEDKAGNTSTSTIIPDEDILDNTPPVLNVSYSNNNWTNGNITVTIKADEAIKIPSGWSIGADRTEITKTYDANASETVQIEDLVGNTTTTQVSIRNIDKTNPTITSAVDPTDWTKDGVTLEINVEDYSGSGISSAKLLKDGQVIREFGGGTLNTVITENGTYVILAEDIAGNTKQEQVTINNIDTEDPTVRVAQSRDENNNVVLSITANDTLSGIDKVEVYKDGTKVKAYYAEGELIYTQNYTALRNGSYVIKVTDKVGLTKTTEPIQITSYDTVAPTLQVEYSKQELTNGDVKVTITANEAVQAVDGWTFEDSNVITKTYSGNIQENVRVYDLQGNYSIANVTITNIDKILPTVTVTGNDETVWTKSSKTLNIEASDNKQLSKILITKDGETLWETTNSSVNYAVYENGLYVVKAIDKAGNEKQIEAPVNSIDRISPVILATELVKGDTYVTMNMYVLDNESGINNVKVNGNNATKVSDGVYTYTARVNGTYEIAVTDNVGWVTTDTRTISIPNLDTTTFEADVRYSTNATNTTNENVEVTITANKEMQSVNGWTLSEDNKTLTKIYTRTANETVTISDTRGTTITKEINVSIDKEFNPAQVTYSTKNPINTYVLVRITSNERLQEIANWNLDSTGKVLTKYVYENTNGDSRVTIKDLAGNEQIVTYNVNNIDKVKPELTVDYSTTESTNGEVVATIRANEEIQDPDGTQANGWTLLADRKSMTKTYRINTNEIVTVLDLAGNEQEINVEISNIDKTELDAEVRYSNTAKTRESVKVTIYANKEIDAVDGWILSADKMSISKSYVNNVSREVVTLRDNAGNTKQVNVTITNIDTTSPEVTNTIYSPSTKTNTDVLVTIKVNEELQDTNRINGWTLSSDRKTLTKTYAANQVEEITVKDIAGNETQTVVSVANIDKEGPALEVEYSTKEITRDTVTATIKSNEEMQSVAGWILSSDMKSMSKIYTINTYETVKVYDLVGNSSEIQVKVENIDTEELRATIEYTPAINVTNGKVTATIKSNKELQVLNGWALSGDKKTLAKDFYSNVDTDVTITDLVGNTKNVEVIINNIDTDAPTVVGNVTYTPSIPTKDGVTVRIETSEPIKDIAGWNLDIHKKVLTKEYTENTREQIEIEDLAGNKGYVDINVTNIDKENPELSIEYSTTESTNGEVVATIRANEEIQDPDGIQANGWELSTDRKSISKTYSINASEVIKVKDAVGNESEIRVEIENIDKTELEAEIRYSELNKTKEQVEVTILANKEIDAVDGWILSDDNMSIRKSYVNNVSREVVTLKDKAGNTKQVNVTITNIDTTSPQVTNTIYSPSTKTNTDVLVTIKVNEELQDTNRINGWALSSDRKTLTKTYTANEVEEITIKDIAGNETQTVVSVENIDKEGPALEVEYSTKETTGGLVEVTIKVNEEVNQVTGWELSSDRKSLRKSYNDNTYETVKVYDLVGNSSEIQVVVENIDTEELRATIEYTPSSIATNGKVTATIKSNKELQVLEGWVLSEDNKTLAKDFYSNVDTEVTIKDLVGNTRNVEVVINNIDTEAPTVVGNVTYTPDTPTNDGVTVRVEASEPIKDIPGWNLDAYKKVLTKEYTENTREQIEIEDIAGNKGYVNINVTNIDKEKPELSIEYSTTESTNGDVVATIRANEEIQDPDGTQANGWTLSADRKSISKTYEMNTNEVVKVKDAVGNESEIRVEIENIDKTELEAEVRYSELNKTKEQVVVTILANKEIDAVEGWTLSTDKMSISKAYVDNVSGEEVTLKDKSGNTKQVSVTITNIDTISPQVTNTIYSPNTNTNTDVLVTIKVNEELQDTNRIDGWALSSDRKTLTKTYTANEVEEITIKDIAGNETQTVVSVANIDKEGPALEVEYSTKEITANAVEVTIKANEECEPIAGWTLSSDRKSMKKLYSVNAYETVKIYDLVGNSSEIQVKVENIDTEELRATIEYTPYNVATNGKVTATIKSNKELQVLEGWVLSEDKKTQTKDFYSNVNTQVTIKDLVGNIKNIDVVINNIDTEAPTVVGNVTYIPNTPTKEGVIARVEITEPIKDIPGWNLDAYRKVLTKEYTENTKEQIEIEDISGNKGHVDINVTNIDKENPELSIEYSTTESTNGSVVATIRANEEIQDPDGTQANGWELSTDRKSISKTYSINTSEVIKVKDAVGNESEIRVEIENIDKTNLEAEVRYSEVNKTKEQVRVTILANKEIEAVGGWTLSDDKMSISKSYVDNVSGEIVTLIDKAGNTKQVSVTINNIDTIRPQVIDTVYSPSTKTNTDVLVTITVNEELQDTNRISGWTLSSDRKTLTKTYTANEVEEITIKDIAGNESQTVVSVANIDKEGPALEVEYSTKEITRDTVTATIKSNEEMQSVAGWILSSDMKSMSKIYTMNTYETVKVYDLVGNSSEIQVVVENIDKEELRAMIIYTPNDIATNGKVTATIKSNKELQVLNGWVLSEDKKTLTKDFYSNVNTQVTIKDLVENTKDIDVVINNIDTEAPTVVGNVTYTPDTPTNDGVTVRVELSEPIKDIAGWNLDEHKKILTKEYGINTEEQLEIEDIAGNKGYVNINVTNIDKIAPEVNISYDITDSVNGKVTATITSNEKLQAIPGWTASNNYTIFTKEYTENVVETLTVKDLAGNQKQLNIRIVNIDANAPIGTVRYSSKEITNQDIIVTIDVNEEILGIQGWSLSNSGKTLTRTYTENTQTPENIVITDLAGNTSTVIVSVTNIDKQVPVCREVVYTPSYKTKDTVVATIYMNEEIKGVPGWELLADNKTLTKTYTQNTAEDVEIEDIAGNKQTVNVNVTNIDKDAPIATVQYSNKEATNNAVKVTISANERLRDTLNADGWILSDDGCTYTKMYGTNTRETVKIYDLVGNETEVPIEITNINAQNLDVDVKYSTREITKGNVTVTISANEILRELAGWTLSDDRVELTKTFAKNISTEVIVVDEFGNVANVAINISNIDKKDPEATVSYSIRQETNENIVVTVEADEAIKDVEGWTRISDRIIQKSFGQNTAGTITIEDLAGNTTVVPYLVRNIDKDKPNLTVTYSKEEYTRNPVTVIITSDKQLATKSGWALSSDGLSLLKTYEENATENVTVYDTVGNKRDVIVKVTNIDREAPTQARISVIEGTQKNNAWYATDVILQIFEGEDLVSGILKTTYTINGREVTVQNGERFRINEDGVYNIDTYSYDVAGNITKSDETLVIKRDTKAPENFELDIDEITTRSIKMTAKTTDETSGIKEYRYYINGNEYITTQEEMFYDNLPQETQYNIYVEAEDYAGYITRTSTKSATTMKVPSAQGTIEYSKEIWRNEKASLELSTNEDFDIEYQINGTDEGRWTKGTNVEDLLHNDIVYARLTDGVNAGEITSYQILDEIVPTKPILGIIGGTVGDNNWYTSDVIISVQSGTDAESGVEKVVYTVNGQEEKDVASDNKIKITEDNVSYEIKAWTIDKAGNRSDVSNIIRFKLDKTVPNDFSIETVNVETDSITVKSTTTDNLSETLKYKYKLGQEEKEAQEGVEITFDNLTQNTEYTISCEATDEAGNTREVTTSAIKTKGVPGAIVIDDRTGEEIKNIVFSEITWEDEKAEVELSTPTKYDIEFNVNTIQGEWTKGTKVEELKHADIVYVRLTDTKGNKGEYTFIVIEDTQAPTNPTVEVIEGEKGENDWYISNVKVKMTAGEDAESGVDKVTYKVNEGAEIEYTQELELTSDGKYEITAYTIDKAGLKSKDGTVLKINKQSGKPQAIVNVTSLSNGYIIDATDSTSQPSKIVKYEYYIDGELISTSEEGIITVQGLEQESEHEIYVVVTNEAGISEQSRTITQSTSQIPDAVIGQTIEFTNPIWTNGKASVEIRTNTNYKTAYKVNTLEGEWTQGNKVENIENNSIIYAVLTDGTNISNYVELVVEDLEKPSKPQLNITKGTKQEDVYISNVVVKVVQGSDEKSGIDYTSYTINNGEETRITKDTEINLTKDGQYEITAYSVDKAGNTSETTVINIEIKKYFMSDVYTIDDKEMEITKILPETNLETFEKNIQTNMEYKIVDKDGKDIAKDAYIGTGMKVKLENDKEYTLIVKGDLNGDGRVGITDLAKTKKAIINLTTLTDIQNKAVDIDVDGKIGITDLSKIQKYMIGLIKF